MCLFVLAAYAEGIYPNLGSAWGGGSPTPVVLYLSKDSPIHPGEQISAQLLDQSDAGYYILPTDEKRAIYIPRTAVSLVYFGKQISDSGLLKSSTGSRDQAPAPTVPQAKTLK